MGSIAISRSPNNRGSLHGISFLALWYTHARLVAYANDEPNGGPNESSGKSDDYDNIAHDDSFPHADDGVHGTGRETGEG